MSIISDEIGVYQLKNDGSTEEKCSFPHDPRMLHFLFSLSGNIHLSADTGSEKVELNGENFFLFSNPYASAELSIELSPGAVVLAMVIGMKELHEGLCYDYY